MTLAETIRHAPQPLRLRARWVLPIHMPPIENGEIVIEDGKIVAVGKAVRRGVSEYLDLGYTALLPGFVNVHAHLEQTVLRGYVEDMSYFPWTRRLTALKSHVELDDWITSATVGAAEMLSAGVTTVGDCADAGASLPAMLVSGLRGIVYREVQGMESGAKDEHTLSVFQQRVWNMRAQSARMGAGDRVRVGISPHSAYAVPPSLFMPLALMANKENLSQQIHIGETQDEESLLMDGEGAFADHLRARSVSWNAPQISAVQYVAACGGFEAPAVAVHCIHVDEMDAQLLKIKNVGVAHCPKSNGKLGAGVMPLAMLRREGVTIGLGTDGMASNNAVDMFEEMRSMLYQARAKRKDVMTLTARDALEIATIGGARCLRMNESIGTLETGKNADLCAVSLDGLHLQPTAEDDPIAALVYGARASDVLMSMVEGRVLYDNGRHVLLDTARLRGALTLLRARLRGVKGQDAPRY